MANKTSAKKTAPQPATRNQPARQVINLEAVIARAPHGSLAENLSRTFGLDCPEYAAIREGTEETTLSAQGYSIHHIEDFPGHTSVIHWDRPDAISEAELPF